MEEAIFPALITSALLATQKWRLGVAWALALGGALFAARVGGDASLPTVVAWSGLAVACALALWGYLPRLRSTSEATLPSGPRGTTALSP
jgi:hypothetical protein